MPASLEHVNITVSDPKATAAVLIDLFDWKIRWEGVGMKTGYTVHVGTDTGYVALFSFGDPAEIKGDHFYLKGALNHIGITVDDLDTTEAKVKAAGFETHSHADYEPGQRFYFNDHDGVEYEVVSYL
jgi:catechol 2,3-dioxygenase-like lactoylglutathione lyase family enzyme